MKQTYNLNHFVAGRYVGCSLFTGSKVDAIAAARELFIGSYLTRVSVESKSGLIVAVVCGRWCEGEVLGVRPSRSPIYHDPQVEALKLRTRAHLVLMTFLRGQGFIRGEASAMAWRQVDQGSTNLLKKILANYPEPKEEAL